MCVCSMHGFVQRTRIRTLGLVRWWSNCVCMPLRRSSSIFFVASAVNNCLLQVGALSDKPPRDRHEAPLDQLAVAWHTCSVALLSRSRTGHTNTTSRRRALLCCTLLTICTPCLRMTQSPQQQQQRTLCSCTTDHPKGRLRASRDGGKGGVLGGSH